MKITIAKLAMTALALLALTLSVTLALPANLIGGVKHWISFVGEATQIFRASMKALWSDPPETPFFATTPPTHRLRIAEISRSSRSHPTQWEGFLSDGRAFFITYQRGVATMIADPSNPLNDDAETLMHSLMRGVYSDSFLPYDTLRGALSNVGIDSPTDEPPDGFIVTAMHDHEIPDEVAPTPRGLRKRVGVEWGCGQSDCLACYEKAT